MQTIEMPNMLVVDAEPLESIQAPTTPSEIIGMFERMIWDGLCFAVFGS